MQTLSSLDRSEVLRYLGWRGNELSANMEDMVLRCIHEMCQAAKPTWLYRRFSVRRTEEGLLLEPSSLLLAGKDIAAHLSGWVFGHFGDHCVGRRFFGGIAFHQGRHDGDGAGLHRHAGPV